MTTVVWFKRDLRTHDHGPLLAAAERGRPVIPLYVVEPGYWQLPDTSDRHWGFIRESLVDLGRQLRALSSRLVVMHGPVLDVLETLHAHYGIGRIFCHQETGGQWTFDRDRDVIRWCQAYGIEFREWRQFGVVRRLPDRDQWDTRWQDLMGQPVTAAPDTLPMPEDRLADWPDSRSLAAPEVSHRLPCPDRQTGGSTHGDRLLASFLERRVVGYQYRISSPTTATRSCSRLSPHIAYGTVSLRHIYQQARATATHPGTLPRKEKSLRSFRSRLHWHCHFIQKLEDEPELEFRAIHRDLEKLKDGPGEPERLQRWQEGMTGWPLVDASMRALKHGGWINFRMRAMLMAVASYQLWLHWREPALHLARLFTDFEPGIHYPQVQMQSGLTGINALRIYNPERQSTRLDADGTFIRQWLPELAGVPDDLIHTPWLMSPRQRQRYGGNDYPAPVCDHEQAAREARRAMGRFLAEHVRPGETERVLARHGSRRGPVQRRPGRPRGQADDDHGQLSLFSDGDA